MFYEAIAFFLIILIFIVVFTGVVYYTAKFSNIDMSNATQFMFSVAYLSFISVIIVFTCFLIEKILEAKRVM